MENPPLPGTGLSLTAGSHEGRHAAASLRVVHLYGTELGFILANVVLQGKQQTFGMFGRENDARFDRCLGAPGVTRIKSMTNSDGACEMMARLE